MNTDETGTVKTDPRRGTVSAQAALLLGAFILAWLTSCAPPDPPEDSGTFERLDANPILKPGFAAYPGGPTVDSVSDPDVLFDENLGLWRMWFAVSYFEPAGDFFTGIMHAESADGFSWDVTPGLALAHAADSSAWDYTSTETPSVVIDAGADPAERYRLYYSGGNIQTSALGDYPRFQIGGAVSADGYTFTRIAAADSPYGVEGLVLRVEDSLPAYAGRATTGVVADPEARIGNGSYELWFTVIGLDSQDRDVAGGIGFATSPNGTSFTAYSGNPLDSVKRFEEDFTAQPSVLRRDDGTYELWYNADLPDELDRRDIGPNGTIGFWRATGPSATGPAPPSVRAFAYHPNDPLEERGFSVGADVVRRNGVTRLYYGSLADTEAVTFPDNPFGFTYILSVAMDSGGSR